ncbi:MAG: preprotein translocase subunit SecA [Alphaproteobacteria bacterium]
MSIFSNLFASDNDRLIKKFQPMVARINGLEKLMQRLSPADCRKKIASWQKQLQASKDVNADMDTLLPEVFALTREAARRVLSLRHFDVQLIGGMVLHQGMICEMKTGEGKTLVATLASVLNALVGRGVHVVTVNDYLASRDAAWMGKIYEFLGLSVGVIVPGLDDNERQKAYAADITYGTNNEFGFDYLRDNLKLSLEQLVQRGHFFVIVDEVDSILIDEARTPLIISGPTNETSELYYQIDALIPLLQKGDFELHEKDHNVILTDVGHQHLESLIKQKTKLMPKGGLFDFENLKLLHHADQALRAHYLFKKDKDYIVKNGQVVIIDEFTGRMMAGRRYSEGLHQALEAKEKVAVEPENQTIASTTFQNYFRLYKKLSGMTGTALTERLEFDEIYKLAVVAVPTHEKMIRQDHDDEIYRTAEERNEAVIKEIISAQKRGQPVLVGTVSIEKSEQFAELLKKQNIAFQVLNARQHEKEAEIIADAGCLHAVTIATNMAGRGTDIQLGGNLERRIKKLESETNDTSILKKQIIKQTKDIADNKAAVLKAGGLYIIGTERHESRRIDNQLRGRAGRQGDIGASKFFISLEDDLMRIFGSEKINSVLQKLGLERGEAIVHGWISKALEKAQQKVEERNFEIRKHLLKYDDVMNDQRKIIFNLRKQVMSEKNAAEISLGFVPEVLKNALQKFMPEKSLPEQWQLPKLVEFCQTTFAVMLPIDTWQKNDELHEDKIMALVEKSVADKYKMLEKKLDKSAWQQVTVGLFLQVLDHLWKEHLRHLDYLRAGIGLRAYGQRDPLNEYKQEAFVMFEQLLATLQETIVGVMCHLEIEAKPKHQVAMDSQNAIEPPVAMDGKVATPPPSRNSPCPCGSKKKYKHCHGAIGRKANQAIG